MKSQHIVIYLLYRRLKQNFSHTDYTSNKRTHRQMTINRIPLENTPYNKRFIM